MNNERITLTKKEQKMNDVSVNLIVVCLKDTFTERKKIIVKFLRLITIISLLQNIFYSIHYNIL